MKCVHGPGGKGPGCGDIVQVRNVREGFAVVAPENWWAPMHEYWEGRCSCRIVRRLREWELYKALGWA